MLPTFHWAIDAGAIVQVIGMMSAGFWFLWRVCIRFVRVEGEIKSQGEMQDQRYAEVASKLVERNALQDERHRENRQDIQSIRDALMKKPASR